MTTFTNDIKHVMTQNFLLKEDGYFLLKEDGFKIILGGGDGINNLGKNSTSFTDLLKVSNTFTNQSKN